MSIEARERAAQIIAKTPVHLLEILANENEVEDAATESMKKWRQRVSNPSAT